MVTGMTPLPDLHANSTAINNATEIDCFIWNESRYCIIGRRMLAFLSGKWEIFLDDLPVKPEDKMKVNLNK